MSTAFSRSTRSLRTDTIKASTLLLFLTTFLLILWGMWFFLAQITIYEIADRSELVSSAELVAYFPATALGRVQSGQAARLRLTGFPSIQYGTVAATVTSVTNKPDNDWVEVKLTLTPNTNTQIPLQRGMPGQAEIEIEQVSPAVLALRSVGYWTATNNPSPSTASKAE